MGYTSEVGVLAVVKEENVSKVLNKMFEAENDSIFRPVETFISVRNIHINDKFDAALICKDFDNVLDFFTRTTNINYKDIYSIEHDVANRVFIIKAYYNYVKWHLNAPVPSFWKDVLGSEDLVAYDFVRIGESIDDIEELMDTTNYDLDVIPVARYIDW